MFQPVEPAETGLPLRLSGSCFRHDCKMPAYDHALLSVLDGGACRLYFEKAQAAYLKRLIAFRAVLVCRHIHKKSVT